MVLSLGIRGGDLFYILKILSFMLLCNSKKIYVLDEPSANLDRIATLRLQNLLLQLKNSGKTLLISEHRLYYLRDVADQVVMLIAAFFICSSPAGKIVIAIVFVLKYYYFLVRIKTLPNRNKESVQTEVK